MSVSASQQEHVYLSVAITNPSGEPTLAKAVSNLTSSVVQNQSHYQISVDRSILNTGTLPLYRYIQDTTQAIPPTGIASTLAIQMSYNGTTVTFNVIVDEDPVNTLGNGLQYVDVLTYTRFVYYYNKTLAICIAELKAIAALPALCPDPILSFSGSTDRFSLFLEDYGVYFDESLVPFVSISMNTALQNLLRGFDLEKTGLWYRFRTLPSASSDVILVQDYSYLSNFSPIKDVVLETSLNIGNQLERDNATGLLSETPVLRDYILLLGDETSSTATAVFNLVTQREYLDLQSTSGLSQITIQVFWRCIFGFKHEVYQAPYSASNVKLYLHLKEQYKNKLM